MIQNNPQIWSKKPYNNNDYLWQNDSFVRKDNKIHESQYTMDEIYSHGLSTHLFDRNNGIYTYHKKKIDIKHYKKHSNEVQHKIDSLSFNTIKRLPSKWKASIKKSKLFKGE